MAKRMSTSTLNRDKRYIAAYERYLCSRELGNNNKEVLSYLIWQNREMSLVGKCRALRLVASFISRENMLAGCVFSEHDSLRGFLELYCDLVKRLKNELFESKHGIDFCWAIVLEAKIHSDIFCTSITPVFYEDNNTYGDFESAIEAATEYVKSTNRKDVHIVITAKYWHDTSIHIQMHFNFNGDLLHIVPEPGYDEACAFLLACLKVEQEEASAYRDKCCSLSCVDQIDDQGLQVLMEYKRINPLTDIEGNHRLEVRREYHFQRYFTILEGFSKFDINVHRGLLIKVNNELSIFF